MSDNEYTVPEGAHSSEVIDDILDNIERQFGKHTAQNKGGDMCGGDKPIRECKTTGELTKKLIEKVLVIEPNPLDVIKPELFKLGARATVEMTCDECSVMCHAAARVIDGKPSERIRYTYEDADAASPFKGKITKEETGQAPIPTSFDGTYFKNDPNQPS